MSASEVARTTGLPVTCRKRFIYTFQGFESCLKSHWGSTQDLISSWWMSHIVKCASAVQPSLMWHVYSSFTFKAGPLPKPSNRRAPENVHFQLVCWGIFPRNLRVSDSYKRTAQTRISCFPCQLKIQVKRESVGEEVPGCQSHVGTRLWKLTYTHAPTAVQQESRFTDAFEAAVFVDTQSVKAHVPDQTLVLVWRFNKHS